MHDRAREEIGPLLSESKNKHVAVNGILWQGSDIDGEVSDTYEEEGEQHNNSKDESHADCATLCPSLLFCVGGPTLVRAFQDVNEPHPFQDARSSDCVMGEFPKCFEVQK